jgi:hypothetical protein
MNSYTFPLSTPFGIRLKITFPSTSGSSDWSLSFRFYDPKRCIHLPPIRGTCFGHLILRDHMLLTIFNVAYKLWSCSLCSLLQSLVSSSLFGPSILLSAQLSNILCLCLSCLLLFSRQNSGTDIFTCTTCFGLLWPSSGIQSFYNHLTTSASVHTPSLYVPPLMWEAKKQPATNSHSTDCSTLINHHIIDVTYSWYWQRR